MPFERVDKVRKASYDYSKAFRELTAIWDARHKMSLIHWLSDSFAASKWEEPMGWRRRIVENVPLQENSHDYGVSVMASVEHVLLNLKFEFTQRDMMYYRCKLVINQYNRQLELYKKRDQQSG
ncbi:hypothetical protein MRB53_002363 [Persea americana]|uniref:Uncharacterized protein n=1 Tax=Persea americana TaxID=3435 RepID=A0ACC2MV89_PERAE|nr:hypothetical protein MRB53_002363 [Persea americana]